MARRTTSDDHTTTTATRAPTSADTDHAAASSATSPDTTIAYPASTAWEKPGFVLWHATLEWQRQVAAALKEVGLTHVQFVLLAGAVWLEERTGPPSQRELADHAGTNAMMTSQVVRTLEKAALLERTVDPVDTRVKRLSATPEGAALARKAVGLVEGVDRRVFASVDDRPRFVGQLRSVARRDESGTRIAESSPNA